jgi:hypothetical protein
MQPGTLLSFGALCAVLAVSAHRGNVAPPAAATAPLHEPTGHLVLIVQGDANELRVTGAVAKATPCGAQPKAQSNWQVRVLGPGGVVLHSQPLDLSGFDVDPDHVGRPDQAVGCVVRSTHVAMLVNVPAFANATAIEFVCGGVRKGCCPAVELDNLLRQLGSGSGR